METEIDIFEYEWWKVCVGHFLLLAFSMVFIGTGYFAGQTIDAQSTFPFPGSLALSRLYWLSIVGCVGLVISVLGLWSIRSVPRLIRFRPNSIDVAYPFGQERVFLYDDISRIVINGDIMKRSHWSAPSLFPFRVRMYFLNNTLKIMFNPDRLMNFPAVLDGFKKKGLGSIIEHEYFSPIAG